MIPILWSIVGVIEIVAGIIFFACGISCTAEMLVDIPYVNTVFTIVGAILVAGGIRLMFV